MGSNGFYYIKNEKLFKQFKELFSECSNKIIQNAILSRIRAYVGNFKKKEPPYFESYADVKEGYYNFHTHVAEITSVDLSNNVRTRDKPFQDLEDPNYCENSIHKFFKTGEYDANYAFAVYYWFHYFEKSYAEDLDKEILSAYLLECPDLKNKLNNLKIEIQKNGFSIEPNVGPGPPVIVNEPPKLTDEEWLDPENQESLPFFGRDDEIRRLNAFANDSAFFLILPIIGPSGAGKTRLVNAWRWNKFEEPQESSAVIEWKQEVLSLEDKRDWSKWHPECKTLLIIDDLFNLSEILKAIRIRCKELISSSYALKVRLIVVDHIFPERLEDLMKDPHWKLSNMAGSEFNRDIRPLFFKDGPIRFKAADATDPQKISDQNTIIESIIQSRAGSEVNTEKLEEAKLYLWGLSGGTKEKPGKAWHPLFAALLGDSLFKNKNYQAFSRRDLIFYYLKGSNRLPWMLGTSDGLVASAFIAAATACGGLNVDLLKKCIDKENALKLKDGRYTELDNICHRIVSKSDSKKICALEPDLLGENFFLLFLQELKNVVSISNYKDEEKKNLLEESFIKMLCVGTEAEQVNSAAKFLGFIKRLVINLGNDEDGESHWGAFFDFMQPEHFPKDSKMRRAVVIALGVTCDQRAINPLSLILNNPHEDYRLRINATESLGRIGGDCALKSLIDILSDEGEKSVYLRECAAKALGTISDIRALEPLIDVLESNRARRVFDFLKCRVIEVITQITRSNQESSRKVSDNLLRFLYDEAPYVRLAVVEALGELGNDDCLLSLITCVEDKDDEVAIAAVHAVYQIGGEVAVRELLNRETLPQFIRDELKIISM